MRKFTFCDSFQSQTRKKRWLDCLSLFMVFLVGQFINAQEYQHLQIATGFTQDVIANGVGNASASTTSGVDVVNFAFVSTDFQATVSSPVLTFGLPVDGLITSAAEATPNLTFQLASYTGTNSLKLEAQNSSSTLTFSNNVAAKKLLFLVTSGSGTSTFTGVITFADNSTQTISSSTVPDWFNSTALPVALSGIGRVNTTNNTTENPAGNPRLYQLEIPILVANQTKVISSIEITKTSLAGNALNLFAVTAELLGACPSPDALTASTLTTSATVSWNIPAILPTEGYQYYYSDVNTPPTGSTVPSGTVLSSATSVALSSLLPSQNYYFWIRSNCGNDEFGTWQFVSFTTATPGHIGSGSATSSYFPIYSCFGYNYSQQIYLASELQAVLEPGNTYISKIRFKSTTLPTTPANFASWTVYMGNTTQSVFVDSESWVPAANLTQVYSGNLTFTANGWVEISLNVGFVWDGTSNLVIGVDENTPNYSCTATWASFPSGSNRGILYYSDGTNPDPALPPTANYGPNANIAQIQIVSIVPPNCLPPSSIVVSNVTANGADFAWSPVGVETSWQYAVGLATVTDPSGLTPVDVIGGVPMTTLSTGLVGNTNYKVWVRSDCGTEFSPWAGPVTFKTLCDDATEFSENFDSLTSNFSTTMPDCWGRGLVGTPSLYVTTGSTSPMSPSNRLYMFVSSTATPAQHAYAILPSVSNLSAGTHRLRFKAFATQADRFVEIGYLTDPSDLSTYVYLADFQMPSTAVANTQQFTFVPMGVPAGVKNLVILNPGYPGASSTIYIDDVVWEAIPSCPEPTSISVGAITTTSAQLTWTEGGAATAWNIEWGTAGFTPTGTPNILETTTNPHNLTGLNPNTAYSFYVQASCGGTSGSSVWIGPFNFSTLCVPYTIPYFEGFESGYTHNTAVSGCYSQSSITGAAVWTANNTLTTYNRAPRTGSWNAFLQYSNEDWLFIPIELVGGTSYTVELYARQDGATAANSNILISYGTSATTDAMTNAIVPATGIVNGNYQQITGAFTPATSGVYYVGIKGFMNGTPWYISLDDISIDVSPACLAPTNLAVSNVTSNSANLGWTENGTATVWDIEWGTAGFTPTGTPTILGTTTNPHALTGLDPNTAYSFYVRADCGGTTGESTWSGPFNFTTPCVPYTIPYFEGFESGYTHNTAVSGCLVQSSVTGTAVWTANNTLTTYNRAPRTGSWNAFLQYSNEDWLFIPIELVGGTSYTVELYARQDGATAANSNMLISYGTGATAAAMTNAIVPATGIVNGNYQQITGAFTPATSGVYYVGIKGFMNGTPWYISLDDISIDVSPACLAPTNLTVSNVTSNSANLGWTENGTATVWDIEWGTAGFTPTGTPTILGTTTNPHALTGLDPNTAYSFYVRTDCGGTDGESTWAGPFNFTTACIATTVPYVMDFETATVPALPACTSIQNVGTGNLWTVANNPGFGFTTKTLQYLYNGSNAANVWFYTQALNLTAGTTYEIAFDYGSNSTFYVEKLKVAYGTSATAASMTNVVVDLPSISNNTPVTSSTAFTPTTSGVYYFGFNVYSAANQYNLYVDNIVIDVSLSTGSFDSSSFSAYPNPVKDVFNFAYSNTISDLEIYNLLGQQVLATKPNATQGQVDMSSFPNGTYLVKVTSENKTKTIKIIKN